MSEVIVQGDAKYLTALDIAEKIILSLVFLFFLFRMLISTFGSGSSLNLFYLFDQLVILIFVIIRRGTTDITTRPSEWFAGFGGTFVPLLVAPIVIDSSLVPEVAVGALMLTGFGIHISAKFTLRRSFGVVAANRGVKVSGPYRLVRHPMYTGYILVHAGLLIADPNIWNVLIIFLCWSLLIWRINAEERLLRADPMYREMAERIRFRLIPGLY
jgi:protein-S-isoprenylcysteine O-methyltransferase Ste14